MPRFTTYSSPLPGTMANVRALSRKIARPTGCVVNVIITTLARFARKHNQAEAILRSTRSERRDRHVRRNRLGGRNTRPRIPTVPRSVPRKPVTYLMRVTLHWHIPNPVRCVEATSLLSLKR